MRTAPAFLAPRILVLQLVTLLESLYPSGCIQHSAFTREKRMTITANLDLKLFSGRTGFKSSATGANYLGIIMIFRMNFIFHCKLSRVNADLSPVFGGWFILNDTIDKSVQRIVLAYTHIITWENTGAALAD
jgi:hypothetical protein